MTELEFLDSHQTLETLFKRDYNSVKFVNAVYLDNKRLATYISDELNDMEPTYLIEALKDRRRAMYSDN